MTCGFVLSAGEAGTIMKFGCAGMFWYVTRLLPFSALQSDVPRRVVC